MDGSTNHADRPAKKCKVAGRVSYGSDPLEYTGVNKEKMFFDIHNFAELQEKREEFFYTEAIQACGHEWKALVYPRGHKTSKTDAEYTGIHLSCANKNIETNPVHAKACIRTKTKTHSLHGYKYIGKEKGWGCVDFKKREDIIRKDLNPRNAHN